MSTAVGDEMVRLAMEALQDGKAVSLLLEGDPGWFRVFTLDHCGNPSSGGLFSARVEDSSGGYSRLLARKDRIVGAQIA